MLPFPGDSVAEADGGDDDEREAMKVAASSEEGRRVLVAVPC